MSLTQDQLSLRKKCVGASESAAVLGLSPWESAADVYYRKVGDVEPEKASEAMERGIALEPMLIDWAARELNLPAARVARHQPTVIHKSMPLGVTLDAGIIRPNGNPWDKPIEAIEAKTSSQPELWGEPGSDEIPEQYVIQCQQQMFVLGIERVWVPVLLLGYRAETRMYCVNRNDELAEAIAQRVTAWWKNHVEARVPPTNEPPPLDFLKRLRRQPKSTVMLGAQAVELVDAWERAKEVAKAAESAKETAQAAVMALLGIENPAEEGVMPDGRAITYMSQRSAPAVNRDVLRAKWPEAFDACVSQGFHRVLRVKGKK